MRAGLRMWAGGTVCWALGLMLGAVSGVQAQRLSGHAFMSPSTQALQNDDALNPAFLWVRDGQQRFEVGCARCHSVASLRGVATRYPAWDAQAGKPVTLSSRIQLCQVRHVKAAPWAAESDGLLALEAYVAHQSRGQPIQPANDPRLQGALALGAGLYRQRMGQLDLSCAQCHDTHAGRRLGGSTIPQGHPTGYPLYRLEWQAVGSLHRRLRQCMNGVRAEPYAFASDELTALELFLMNRAAGLPLETPAVRP